jgi:transposase
MAGAQPWQPRDPEPPPDFLGSDRQGRGGEVRHLGTFESRVAVLRKTIERLARDGRRLIFCYEAGPCGYGLYRLLRELGHDCIVVAPSLIPLKPGKRVKTDRRDALTLAKLRRAPHSPLHF